MPPEDRSVQAEDRLYALEYNEVETRKKLDLNGYKFASRLIGLKVTKQDKDGIVSNGFIAFQLIQIAPGVGLGEVDTKEESLYIGSRRLRSERRFDKLSELRGSKCSCLCTILYLNSYIAL